MLNGVLNNRRQLGSIKSLQRNEELVLEKEDNVVKLLIFFTEYSKNQTFPLALFKLKLENSKSQSRRFTNVQFFFEIIFNNLQENTNCIGNIIWRGEAKFYKNSLVDTKILSKIPMSLGK